MTTQNHDPLEDLISLDFSTHSRLSEYQRLVYPVVSRRARGLSLGINVNPNKKCTFNCVYCQVDRRKKVSLISVNLRQIAEELEYWLQTICERKGKYKGFQLKDISIAGDGEPTTYSLLPDLIAEIIHKREQHALNDCKLVLFTNGSKIDRNDLQDVLPRFYNSNGEIWFKLDYWDERSLKRINRTGISAEKLVKNLVDLGRQYPLVLQSCFFSWDNEKFVQDIYLKYVESIRNLLEEGVKIKLIQAYTLARIPMDSRALPWSNTDMERLCQYFQNNLPVKIEGFFEKGEVD